jgi:hypothetical protein
MSGFSAIRQRPSKLCPYWILLKKGEWKGTKIDRISHRAIIAKTGEEFSEF